MKTQKVQSQKPIPHLTIPYEPYIIAQTQAMYILNRYLIEHNKNWEATQRDVEQTILDIFSACENIVPTPETQRYKNALAMKLATYELCSMSLTAQDFFSQFTSTRDLFFLLDEGIEQATQAIQKNLTTLTINHTFVKKHFKYFWDRYDCK